jgi:hypothetical protein
MTSALGGGEWLASGPGERAPRYPLNRRLGGPQSRSGRREETRVFEKEEVTTHANGNGQNANVNSVRQISLKRKTPMYCA